jgi:hypothetical protein
MAYATPGYEITKRRAFLAGHPTLNYTPIMPKYNTRRTLKNNAQTISQKLTSRRLSNAKFRKGAQVEANLARNQLELNDKEGPWPGSKSPFQGPFVHEEDHNRHVKPDRGGRMIS